MQRALAEVALLGVAGGALGCWVVLYGLSYAAESLAHSIFPGLVVAALAGVPLLLGGGPGDRRRRAGDRRSPRGSPGVEPRRRRRGRRHDAVRARRRCWRSRPTRRPASRRCSSATSSASTDADLAPPRRLAALVARRRCALLHGRLLAVGFDRGAARSLGVSPAARRRGAAGPARGRRSSSPSRASATCSSSPSSSARPRPPACSPTGSLPMIALAAAIAVLAGVAGLYLSYYAGTAGGASVALAIVAVYLLSLPLGRLRSARRRRRSRPGLRSAGWPPRPTPPGPSTRSRRCGGAGYRRGGARTAVVEALARHDCAVTALELDDELRRRSPRSAGPASTARSSSSRSSASCSGSRSAAGPPATSGSSPAAHHHHHAICRRCGRMVPFEDPTLERAIDQLSDAGQLRGHRARRRPARPLRALPRGLTTSRPRSQRTSCSSGSSARVSSRWITASNWPGRPAWK